MKLLLLAGIGSFIGGMLRLLVSDLIQTKSLSAFPYGTLAVNITGCFLIGIVFAFFQKETISSEWKIFLATGLIGGFTTFSAFSYETLQLFRQGHVSHAFIYIFLSVVLGLAATMTGFFLFKSSS